MRMSRNEKTNEELTAQKHHKKKLNFQYLALYSFLCTSRKKQHSLPFSSHYTHENS